MKIQNRIMYNAEPFYSIFLYVTPYARCFYTDYGFGNIFDLTRICFKDVLAVLHGD